MKKFLLSTCAIAVASLCVFMTSCKDEDVLNTVVTSSVNKAQVAAAAAAAQSNSVAEAAAIAAATAPATATVTTEGNKVIIADGSTGYTETSTIETKYTYELDGVTYESMDAVQAALAQKPAGSTATITTTLIQITTTVVTAPDGTTTTKDPITTTSVQIWVINIPSSGSQVIVVQTPVSTFDQQATMPVTIVVATTTVSTHSGGAGA